MAKPVKTTRKTNGAAAPPEPASTGPQLPPAELVSLDQLKPHPRNYQSHPEVQIAHLARSLEEFGQYRNVVLAEDDTILAGHGIAQAARSLGWKEIRAVRLPLQPDHPAALKLVVADNELRNLAVRDDRVLTNLLREINEQDPVAGLLGTGYDQSMLAMLLMVTRPASEIGDRNEAAHLAGLPGLAAPEPNLRLIVQFKSHADRLAFFRLIRLQMPPKPERPTLSTWWPLQDNSG